MKNKNKAIKKMDYDLFNGKVRNYKKFMKKYNQLKRETLCDKKKKGGENLCYN